MSDNNHKERNDRIILAAKNFGIWLVCGTLFIVAIKILLVSTVFSTSHSNIIQDNISSSLGQEFSNIAIRVRNYAVATQILWLPITLIISLHTYLSGLPTLQRTLPIIIAVIFVFLAAVFAFAMLLDAMVSFSLLTLFYPFAAGTFCWWLTKIVAFPKS
jgi:hypothetical protein